MCQTNILSSYLLKIDYMADLPTILLLMAALYHFLEKLTSHFYRRGKLNVHKMFRKVQDFFECPMYV